MEKLVEVIHGFFPDFNMSINDLKKPTRAFVRDFYSRVLIELGVDMDNVRKAQIDQLEYAQDMDLLPILNLMTAINTAFPFLKITLFDMLQPSPKKNSMQMSKVMNFMEFCEARVAANNDEIRKFQEAKECESELLEVLESKKRELNDLVCELESCQQEKQELKSNIESLENGSYENKKSSTSLKEAIQKEEENLAPLTREIESLKREISSINKEIEVFNSQVVVNPNEEKRELDAKLRHKDGVLEKKKELEAKLKEFKETKEKMQHQLEILEGRVIPIIQELDVLRISHERESMAQKDKKDLAELQKKKEKLLSDLDGIRKNTEIEDDNLKSQLSVLEKEEESHNNTLECRKSEYELKLKEFKKEKKSLKEEHTNVDKNILNYKNDYNELRSKFVIAVEAMHSQMEHKSGKLVYDM